MIDNVRLSLPILSGDVEEIRKGLNHVKELGNDAYHGYLKNLHVMVRPPMLYIEGSLPRYYLQTNLLTLDIDSTKRAIDSISDCLHVDISDAKVSKLEFGTNFIMHKPVIVYLSKLGDMLYNDRIQCSKETLYYRTGGVHPLLEVKFYDKRKDALKKKLVIPPEMAEDKHILRYELKFSRIGRYLRTNEVRAYQLWDQGFWSRLLGIWHNIYFSINKLRMLVDLSQMDSLTSTDLKEAVIVHLVQKAGFNELEQFVSQIKANQLSNKSNMARFNKYLKKCYNDVKLTCDDPDIIELDGKIKAIYDCNKQGI